jgi:hypothetical protein
MVSRYVVTTAQRGASPNEEFLASLQNYADRRKAKIIIVPTNGVTDDDVLAPEVQEHLIASSYEFSKNFILEDFPVWSQQIRPLTGLGRFIQSNKSAVIGSPKQHLEVLATSNTRLPKILVSTGACTEPHYRANRLGTIAERDHVYGALIIEVDDKTGEFHYRHVRDMKGSGRFIDLGFEYGPTGKPKKVETYGIAMGDLHAGQTDPEAWKAQLGMIRRLQPRNVIVHDLFDACSISHHDLHKQLYRAVKSSQGKLSLTDELKLAGSYLADLRKAMGEDGKIVIVKSNHDEHLNRYLEEGRYGSDPQNLYLSSKLATAMIDGKDPLKLGIELTHGPLDRNIVFLSRDDDYKICGIQTGSHGDLGGNGSRGAITSQVINYGKSIVGHRHTPSIRGDAYCVGTLTKLKLDYNKGPSSWLQTSAVINPDGSVQLVNFINGKYTR